mmetsp:Transcript_20020/g.44434  ORF Transcript_20020/g.44434 Transcript_20020/m.44434 type:complete len:325 (+) Transcript_20020:232-1206(+)
MLRLGAALCGVKGGSVTVTNLEAPHTGHKHRKYQLLRGGQANLVFDLVQPWQRWWDSRPVLQPKILNLGLDQNAVGRVWEQRVTANSVLATCPREVAPSHVTPHVHSPTIIHLPTGSLTLLPIKAQGILIQDINSINHPVATPRNSPARRVRRCRTSWLHSEAAVGLDIRRHLRRGDIFRSTVEFFDFHESVAVFTHGGVLSPAAGGRGGAGHGHGHFVNAQRCCRVQIRAGTARDSVAGQHHLVLVDKEHRPRHKHPIDRPGIGKINRVIKGGDLGGYRGRHAITVLHCPSGPIDSDGVRVIVGVRRISAKTFSIRCGGAVVR